MNNRSKLQNFIIFHGSNMIITAITFPIQFVRLRLQNAYQMVNQGVIEKTYTGVIDCIVRTIKQQGFFVMFTGLKQKLIVYLLINITFTIAGFLIKKLASLLRIQYVYPVVRNFNQAIVSILAKQISQPVQFCITRFVTNSKRFKQLNQVRQQIVAASGLNGLFCSFRVKILQVVFLHLLINLFSTLLPPVKPNNQIVIRTVNNSVAVVACWPFDTIRRRMMMRSGQKNQYSSFRDCYNDIVRNQGFFKLFTGSFLFVNEIIIRQYLFHLSARRFLR